MQESEIVVEQAVEPPAVSQEDEWAGERKFLEKALVDGGLVRIRKDLGGREQVSLLRFVRHYESVGCGTIGTLRQGVFALDRYLGGLGKGAADRAIRDAAKDSKGARDRLQARIAAMRREGLSSGYIAAQVAKILVFYRVNDIVLPHVEAPRARTTYPDRAPTPDELAKVLDVADVRERAIIGLLALGGFRVGTLARLTYGHVRRDVEAGTTPIHVHLEREIMKGKYVDADTFLGAEAADALKAYLELRRRGAGDFPPERLEDASPLIRSLNADEVRGVTTGQISVIVHGLLRRAGLVDGKPSGMGSGSRYRLRPHSLRKFFRTQFGARISADTTEYFLGHKTSTYLDVAGRGLEDLRQEYAKASVSIRPKPAVDARDTIREMIRRLGGDPDKVDLEGAFAHRTVIDGRTAELKDALREVLVGMLREQA
jgi:integrase